VTSNSVHPGAVRTRIWTNIPLWAKPFVALMWPLFKSAEAGAATIVQLAADPSLEDVTGTYFRDLRPATPSPRARDAAVGRRLWEVSERLTNRTPA
jgi:hypothetical protein